MVVAIVATLLALLLPALANAIEAGHQAVCASNLRQIGMAILGYAQDNQDMFPRTAPGDPLPARSYDYVHYRPGWDPMTSAIAPYMGQFTPAVLICPSDDTSVRPRAPILGWTPFPYSYTMNAHIGNFEGNVDPARPIRTVSVLHPSDKFLMVEESETTIDDGNFDPYSGWLNLVAKRHDHKRFEIDPQISDPYSPPFPDARGNILFVDGHVDFMRRDYVIPAEHVYPQL